MIPSQPAAGPIPLEGVVQHYGWGGYDFIADLLGRQNSGRRPFAELWLGAHASAPSAAHLPSKTLPLDQLIASDPAGFLGQATVTRFGPRLPFLFKVLDVRTMLSIQAHPDKRQAEEGYARETAAGIPPKAPQRTYRDNNHKPEIHVALTDFWLLHGFRPLNDLEALLRGVPELSAVTGWLHQLKSRVAGESAVLRELYRHLMTLPQTEVDHLIEPLVRRLERQAPGDRDHPHFWALRAAQTFPPIGTGWDRGLLSIYLLNLVHLHPGEATYQPAGVLHAYLEGTNVELMANSDNVLRGGLTPKHIDVPELLRIVKFEGSAPRVLRGTGRGPGEQAYPTPAADFELSRVSLAPGQSWERSADGLPEIWLVLDGTVTARSVGGREHTFQRGGAWFLAAGLPCGWTAGPAGSDLFRASLPALPATL